MMLVLLVLWTRDELLGQTIRIQPVTAADFRYLLDELKLKSAIVV